MTFIQEAPFLELATQTVTPGTGKQLIYPKTNGNWYVKDDAGVETQLAFTGGSSGTDVTLTPGADARNVVQPTGDFIALVVKNNAAQAKAPFQLQNSSGSITAQIDKNGAFVFNEQGADADSRMEGDTDANLFYLDASTDRIGIGTATPATKLEVNGALTVTGGQLALTPSFTDPVATARGISLASAQTITANSAIRMDALTATATLNNATFDYTNTTGLVGVQGSAAVSGSSGTVTRASGLLFGVTATGGTTITNAVGVQISNAQASAGSAITNAAGAIIANQTPATNNSNLVLGQTTVPTGNWSIYNASSNNNSFAGKLGLGLAANVAPTNDLSFGGNAARVIWMERHTTSNTAGNSLTLQSGGATSGATDKAGGDLILSPGINTGNAVQGLVLIKGYTKSPTTGTGNATQVNRLLTGGMKVLTNNSATNVVSFTAAAGEAFGGIIRYTIIVKDGTDIQSESGFVVVDGVNKGGAFTSAATETGSHQSVSSGTLATTWTITSANPAVVQVNANSSLTPSSGYPLVIYSVDNLSNQEIAAA